MTMLLEDILVTIYTPALRHNVSYRNPNVSEFLRMRKSVIHTPTFFFVNGPIYVLARDADGMAILPHITPGPLN